MATVPEHPLRDEAPGDFISEEAFALELTYDIVNQKLEYRYKKAVVPLGESLIDRLAAAQWSQPLLLQELRARLSLDIEIEKNCTVVLLTDEDKEIFWSLVKDAITTDRDRASLYYELRYRNGGDAVRRVEYAEARCREISFHAKKNTDLNDRSHKFNINITARNAAQKMENILIDPDIKNPSQ